MGNDVVIQSILPAGIKRHRMLVVENEFLSQVFKDDFRRGLPADIPSTEIHETLPEAAKLTSFNSWHNNRSMGRQTNSFTKIKNKSMAEKNLNITPLHDRVIIEPAKAEEKTAGGIIIPDTAKEKPQRGTVVAAGPGKKDEPVTVKVGDTVLYGKYAGTEIQVEGGDYLIMRESDILAIV
jgi:chaperonin GroES